MHTNKNPFRVWSKTPSAVHGKSQLLRPGPSNIFGIEVRGATETTPGRWVWSESIGGQRLGPSGCSKGFRRPGMEWSNWDSSGYCPTWLNKGRLQLPLAIFQEQYDHDFLGSSMFFMRLYLWFFLMVMCIFDHISSVKAWKCTQHLPIMAADWAQTQIHTQNLRGELPGAQKEDVVSTTWHECSETKCWVVGGFNLPLWKIWVRQLGSWHSQYMVENKSHVPNHQPGNIMRRDLPNVWTSMWKITGKCR